MGLFWCLSVCGPVCVCGHVECERNVSSAYTLSSKLYRFHVVLLQYFFYVLTWVVVVVCGRMRRRCIVVVMYR